MSINSTDPIADMLTRIRNALLINQSEVLIPYSKFKHQLAKLFYRNKFIDQIVVEDDTSKNIKLILHDPNSPARISYLKRISKPGRRVYVAADEIPTIKSGRGVVVVSTSQGLMTGRMARRQKTGGELICSIY